MDQPDQVVWYECTVKHRDRDAPAITAWAGVGLIVYTEPVPHLHFYTAEPEPDHMYYRYVIAGYFVGLAPTVEEAMAECLRLADSADRTQSNYRNEREWFGGPIKLVERRRSA